MRGDNVRKTIGVLLIGFSGSALAGQGPEDVVKQYNAAYSAHNWEAALAQVRPADVAKLRDAVVNDKRLEPLRGRCFPDASGEDIAKMSDVAVASCLFKALAVSSPTLTTIGSVKESRDTVHFVVRRATPVGNNTNIRMEVVTVVNEQGKWHVMLPQSIGGDSPPPPPR
jgi:hypothetical protein